LYFSGIFQCFPFKYELNVSAEPKSQDAQTQGLTWGSHPIYIANAGWEPRVNPRVSRPEMWALFTGVTLAYVDRKQI
jgi:hypothetical protein